MVLVSLPETILTGQADDPSRDMSNWTTLRDAFNGNIDDDNIATAADIATSKLELGTGSSTSIIMDNNVQILFENSSNASDCYIREDTSDNLEIGISATKKLVVTDKTDIKFEVDHGNNLVTARDGYKLRATDSADAKTVDMFHDGTNAQIQTSSGQLILDTSTNGTYAVIKSVKTDTGDPTGASGMIYINTFDNAIKMYADGAWRTLASW